MAAPFHVAEATHDDAEGLADLLIAMQAHAAGPAPPRAVILSNIRSLPAGARALVARAQSTLDAAKD